MRTFVIADAHGHPETIRRALSHGGFDPARDRFVFGGDFLDRGPDPKGCLELIQSFASEVLLGNHDVAVLLDAFIWPQDPESLTYRPLLVEKVLNTEPTHAWKAVAAVEGVLVSHAGISAGYEPVFRDSCRGDPAAFADYVNAEFREAVSRRLHPEGRVSEIDGWADEMFGEQGPFWFRPPPFTHSPPLAGVVQVAGHSPPARELAASGFHMIDPCVWLGDFGEPRWFRYAVIEGGLVRVEEGILEEPILEEGILQGGAAEEGRGSADA